jgi:glycosyltransferase involved in cell wall biosynthesis
MRWPGSRRGPGANDLGADRPGNGGPPPAGLSVVLPAFNEEANAPAVIQQGLEVLPELVKDFELIIVDDGSSDDTVGVVSELVEQHYPRVRLLRHERNRGYGAALRSGLGNARFDLIFYTDADRQFDLSELAYFVPLINGHDLVIGFRVYRYDTVLRSILSWIYNRLVGVLFRVRVRDVDCAYKLMTREVLDKLWLESDDFFVDAEIVARARKWNFRITQKGVRHYPRVAGETTVRPSDIPSTLREIARMWRRIYMPTRKQRREAAEADTALDAVEVLPSAVAQR